jgi:hypothetical protein
MTEPTLDPPIDEIREIRRNISAEFNHDAKALIEHYMKLQEQYKDRLLDTSKDKDRDEHAA